MIAFVSLLKSFLPQPKPVLVMFLVCCAFFPVSLVILIIVLFYQCLSQNVVPRIKHRPVQITETIISVLWRICRMDVALKLLVSF